MSFERLRGYLETNPLHVLTDTKNVEHMDKVADHNPRVRRWLEFLNSYEKLVKERRFKWQRG